MDEPYLILIRGEEGDAATLPLEPTRARLGGVPLVEAAGEDRYTFGEPDEHGVMELELATNAVRVTIPRAWVFERGPQVFALVFMIQGWTGWTVFDPQIGQTLQREAVLQGLVAMRQARMTQEEREQIPQPELRPNEPLESGRASPEPGAPSPRKRRRWRFW